MQAQAQASVPSSGATSSTVAVQSTGQVVTVPHGQPQEVQGRIVSEADYLLATLARPNNANLNIRLQTDLAERFEDAIDEAAYETGLTKAAITTLAIGFLMGNWEQAVTDKVANLPRRRRRGRQG